MSEEEGDEEEEKEVSADEAPGPVVLPLRQGRAMSERRAYLLLLSVIAISAGHFPLTKLALEEPAPPTLSARRPLRAAPTPPVIARVTPPRSAPRAWGA